MNTLQLPKRYFNVGRQRFINKTNKEMYKLLLEFEDYQKINYFKKSVVCLCGKDNSYTISAKDRDGFEFILVICRSCGLIRAEEYWDEQSVKDFYTNWYRKMHGANNNDSPDLVFQDQIEVSKEIYDFIEEFINLDKKYTIVDIGGGAGGILSPFLEKSVCYLFDYNINFLKFASEKGIHSFCGGIDEFSKKNIKADVVILSHVIEHMVEANKALELLASVLKIGTYVFVSLPGIDSLKLGRREYDFLGDIQNAHVFYFSTETLNNLMERYGFKCLKMDTEIKALYEYTGNKKELKNYYDEAANHIKEAESARKKNKVYLLFYHFMDKIFERKNFILCFVHWVFEIIPPDLVIKIKRYLIPRIKDKYVVYERDIDKSPYKKTQK